MTSCLLISFLPRTLETLDVSNVIFLASTPLPLILRAPVTRVRLIPLRVRHSRLQCQTPIQYYLFRFLLTDFIHRSIPPPLRKTLVTFICPLYSHPFQTAFDRRTSDAFDPLYSRSRCLASLDPCRLPIYRSPALDSTLLESSCNLYRRRKGSWSCRAQLG